jgi:hypothetical protein
VVIEAKDDNDDLFFKRKRWFAFYLILLQAKDSRSTM